MMSKRSKYYDSRSTMLAKIPQRHPTLHPVVNSSFCGRHYHLKRCSHAVTIERGRRVMCHRVKPSTQDVSAQLPSSQFNSHIHIVLQRDMYRYYDDVLAPDLCMRDTYDLFGARVGTLEPSSYCMVRNSYGISMDSSAIWRR